MGTEGVVLICRRCGPRQAWRLGAFLSLRCPGCGGRFLGVPPAPAAASFAAAAAAGAIHWISAAVKRTDIMSPRNGFAGVHLERLAPPGVMPVLVLHALLDADAGVCGLILEPAVGASDGIAAEAAARVVVPAGVDVTHVVARRAGPWTSMPSELAPVLRRLPGFCTSASKLSNVIMFASTHVPRTNAPREWREGYVAAAERIQTSEAYGEFNERLVHMRPHLLAIPHFVRLVPAAATAAGEDCHG